MMTDDERAEVRCVINHAFFLCGHARALQAELRQLKGEPAPQEPDKLDIIMDRMIAHAMKLRADEDPRLMELGKIAARMGEICNELQALDTKTPEGHTRWWELQHEFTQLSKRSNELGERRPA